MNLLVIFLQVQNFSLGFLINVIQEDNIRRGPSHLFAVINVVIKLKAYFQLRVFLRHFLQLKLRHSTFAQSTSVNMNIRLIIILNYPAIDGIGIIVFENACKSLLGFFRIRWLFLRVLEIKIVQILRVIFCQKFIWNRV